VPPEPPADRALVLGIGNPLMTDDGVGLRLLEALVEFTPSLPGVEYVDAGTLSFLLLPRIECASALLVLDAARLGLHPGAVRSFTGAAMDDFLRGASAGVHDVGLRDLLDAARLTDALPDRRALVGVQQRHGPGFRAHCGARRAGDSRALDAARRGLGSYVMPLAIGGGTLCREPER